MNKPTSKPFPPELAELVDGLLKITADKHPDEIIIIGAVPRFWGSKRVGQIWVIVEATFWNKSSEVLASVRAITGKPWVWQGYHGAGVTNTESFPPTMLRHVMKVENRDVLAYYGTAEGAGAEIFPGAEAADRLSDGYDKDWFDNIEPIEW